TLYADDKELTDLEEADLDYIGALANECPARQAVAMARSIVWLLQGIEMEPCPEETVEDKTGYTENSAADERNNDIVSYLYENYMKIEWRMKLSIPGHLKLYNSIGQLVFETGIRQGENSVTVPVTSFSPGIYHAFVFTEDEPVGSVKTAIIK
ncbi:MAG: T9SS type A sorting domain-containing protein, partial [Bacteroidetes bacterium]|nr:T9SS type A sorting domain-containing protein [Bacteroidota bacterium]